MKKIGKLSLHDLSQAEIAKKEMNALKGGQECSCTCSCYYACPCKYAGSQEGPDDSYYGGSSVNANHTANESNLMYNTQGNTVDGAGMTY